MKSISSRMTLWYALSITLTAAVFMLFGLHFLRQNYVAGIDLLNDTEFSDILPQVLATMQSSNREEALDKLREHTERDAPLFFFQIGNTHEDIFFKSNNLAGNQLPVSAHGQRKTTVTDSILGTLRVGEYQVAGLDIHIAASLQGLVALEDNQLRVALTALTAIFLTSMGIGYGLSRIALRPLSSIEKAATHISAINLSERIPHPSTDDEIGRLIRLLNSMFDRLQTSFEQIQRFTADASHELKTPLSLIRIHGEEMLSKLDGSKEELEELIRNQQKEIDNLSKLISDLLVLAKADGGSLNLTLRRHNCEDMLNDFSQDARALCEDKSLKFVLENNFNGFATFDSLWLRNVLFNLLANSIRVSPAHGTIRLSSNEKANHWEIRLQDQGPGIPEEKLNLVLERFYHDEYVPGWKGSGLGLPICKSIAQLHGGELVLKNRESRSGLIAIIELPIEDPTAHAV